MIYHDRITLLNLMNFSNDNVEAAFFLTQPTRIGAGVVIDQCLHQFDSQICQILGHSKIDLFNKPWMTLFATHQDYQNSMAFIESPLSDKKRAEFLQTVWQRSDGSQIPVELIINPIQMPMKSISFIFSVKEVVIKNIRIPAQTVANPIEMGTTIDHLSSKMVVPDTTYPFSHQPYTHPHKMSQKQNMEATSAGEPFKTPSNIMVTSHEIRTPINTLLGYLQLLQLDDSLSPEHQETIRQMNNIGDHIRLVIEKNLSNYSVAPHSQEFKRFSILALLNELKEMFELQVHQKGILLHYHVDENVSDTLFHDSIWLKQVLINLVYNAIKHTQKGFVLIKIKRIHQSIRFIIKDSGSGIPKSYRSKIFRPCVQVPETNRVDWSVPSGSGLGLYICKGILASFGSEIHVQSKLGKGSKFWFDIAINELTYAE